MQPLRGIVPVMEGKPPVTVRFPRFTLAAKNKSIEMVLVNQLIIVYEELTTATY